MVKKILNWFFKPSPDGTLGDNQAFVTIMRVARKDEEIKKQLMNILEQDPARRKTFLNGLIQRVNDQPGSGEMVEALTYLADDAVAATAYKMLKEENN